MFEVIVIGVEGIVIGLLAGQLWRAQRLYALELAEQARQVIDEQEKARRALQEKEAVARESQAKSEMLATLSQEIRAHLNGIMGSADLMLDSALKPQQREHLTTLRASAESLHQSLNDVLDYSSIETGQIQIGHAPFDLRQPLIEVVESLSPLALLKGLELVLIVPPDVPLQVSGDAARLRQILLNLMANAVKFTASGRVVLRVELPPASSAVAMPGATWLHFRVSDTGAGIPEEMQATIFDRSAKSDAPSTRKFGGSGLELAISKRLVELMGGQIGARSLPEGGSEFWVALALPADEVQAPAAATPADGLHVVVLDDLAASRVAVSAMLARLGVDHDAADTLEEAAILLREAGEAEAQELVLLLDESVVKDGGGDLAHRLAEDATLRSTRIVLMSLDPETVAAAGQNFPVATVVRKPLLRSEVLLSALIMKPGTGELKASSSRTPFEASVPAKPSGRRTQRVLIVDDDKISRSVSSQLLERLGLRRRAGRVWRRCRRPRTRHPFRSHLHGLPDAGNGRLRGDGENPEGGRGQSAPDRRVDRQHLRSGPRAVLCRRHVRFRQQTGAQGGTGPGLETLDPRGNLRRQLSPAALTSGGSPTVLPRTIFLSSHPDESF